MPICALNDVQKKAAYGIIRDIIKQNTRAKAEDILKNIYDVTFHAYIEASEKARTTFDNKKATEYSIAVSQFAAEVLDTILQSEKANDILSQLGYQEPVTNFVSATKYTHETEVRKLLGLEQRTLNRNLKKFTEEEMIKINSLLKAVAQTFPKLSKNVKLRKKIGTELSSSDVVLKAMEGDSPYFHISVFSKDLEPRSESFRTSNGYLLPEGDFVEPLAFGNMVDHAIKTAFRNKLLSMPELKQLLKKDENLIKTFSAYSRNSRTPESNPQSSKSFNIYFDNFIDDLLYTVAKIETEYKDYWITDLSEVIENSGLSQEEKEKFYIYSKEMGLIGELDLLAIKPDGTFRVIDIKTSKSELSDKTAEQYQLQISAYTHLLSQVTGLKAEGVGDIFLVEKEYRAVVDSYKKGDPHNRRKPAIVNRERISKPVLPKKTVEEKALAYRERYINQYQVVSEVKQDTPALERGRFGGRRWGNKKDGGLGQEFVESEPVSTLESIQLEAEWLEKIFPELKGKGVHIVPHLTNNRGGVFFWDMVVLAEKSNQGVGYHEGWHRFSQLYLTRDEKVDLYGNTRKLGLDFTDRNGNKLNTKTATFEQIEEFLAEEFRKYAQNPSEYKFPSKEVTGIFAKIWEFLKSLLNYVKGVNSYEKLFNDVYTGNFYKGNFSTDNAMFSRLNSFFRDSNNKGQQVLDNATFLLYKDYVDGFLANYLQEKGLLLQHYLSLRGIQDLKRDIYDDLSYMRDTVDGSAREEYDKLLGAYDDFFNAYLKTTNYETIRQYASANYKLNVDKIEMSDATDEEVIVEEGTEDDLPNDPEEGEGEGQKTPDGDDQHNKSGNEKHPWDEASSLIKDFFNGIPQLDAEGNEMFTAQGLDKYIHKKKAFAKTLELLEGRFTWEMIIPQLQNGDNHMRFPELKYIADRLIGPNGIYTRRTNLMNEILADRYSGQELEAKLKELADLDEFTDQFKAQMTVPKVRKERLVINLDSSSQLFDEEINIKKNIIYSQEASDTVLTSIINGFTRGFQTNAMEEERAKGKPFMDLYDALYELLHNPTSIARIKQERYFYDSYTKTYHINPYYVQNKFSGISSSNPDDLTREMADFMKLYGIKLDSQVYELKPTVQPEKYKKLVSAFYDLKAISEAYSNYVTDRIADLSSRKDKKEGISWKQKIANLKHFKEGLKPLEADPITNALELEARRTEQTMKQDAVRPFAHMLLAKNPVTELLYLGQDLEIRKNDRYKSFARNYPVFLKLAEIEKDYREYFSSGSVLVKGKPEYSYYLSNQMLIISKIIQYDVKNFDDFEKHPEIQHMNPRKNPQYKNSWIIKNLFDENGNKRSDMEMKISVLTGIQTNDEDGNKTEKKFSELSQDEKLLLDYFLLRKEGSTEIRRAETSNTAWRISLINNSDGNHNFVSPFYGLSGDIFENDGAFKDGMFLYQMRSYVQSSMWRYGYDMAAWNNMSEAERKAEETKEKKGKKSTKIPRLSIWEDMFTKKLLDDIKADMATKKDGYDWNNYFFDLEKSNPKLFEVINDELYNYFEDIAIRNEDSLLNIMNSELSSHSKSLLMNLANNYSGKSVSGGDPVPAYGKKKTVKDLFEDKQFRDSVRHMVANDFIMTMEDSMLFFGDFTYYTDPIKRRKIIANNGTTAIRGEVDGQVKKLLTEKDGLTSVYRKAMGMDEDTEKDFRLVRKTVVKDFKVTSSQLEENAQGESELIKNLMDWYKQYNDNAKGKTDEEIKQMVLTDKANTIDAFSGMNVADGAAYVSLDLYKSLRQAAHTWFKADENEFIRQKLILKRELSKEKNYKGEELTEDEKIFIEQGPYAAFNVAKFATTGPEYNAAPSFMKPVFDKMGLKVMIPETDWKNKRNLFEYMLSNTVDYAVYDSASKGYIDKSGDLWDQNNFKEKKTDHTYMEHAAGFTKLQQNTAAIKDKANFAVQLRGTFFTIMLLHKQNGRLNGKLEETYREFLKNFKDYISTTAKEELATIGLDEEGNFMKDENGKLTGKATFINKIRERLTEINDTDLSLLEKLNVDENGDFVTFLEALPLQREIYNIVSGILDTALRKSKLNGSKLYQTPEIGSGETSMRMKAAATGGRKGTINLKWHGLIRDNDGNIVGVSPVECKVAFKKNFHSLLNLKDNMGEKIGTLERLNEMLKNDSWVEKHKDSLTFVGIRIPLQYLNFTSHMIIREFLPPVEGDSIIVPPEFYQQVGADNDIDTITVSFIHLDKRGKPVKKPKQSYKEINDTINRLLDELDKGVAEANTLDAADEEIERRKIALKNKFIEANVYADNNLSIEDLEREFQITPIKSKVPGGIPTYVFEGLRGGGLLRKLQKNGLQPELMSELLELGADIQAHAIWKNVQEAKKLSSSETQESLEEAWGNVTKYELAQAFKAKSDYIKGVSNNIIVPMVKFLQHPLSYNYVTETDSIAPMVDLAAEIQSIIQQRPASEIKKEWANPKAALKDFGYVTNLINHKNNFQVRSMLGSFVKFSRLLITLAQTDTTLNGKYVSGRIDKLAEDAAAVFNEDSKHSFSYYMRTIWTPLLKDASPDGKIKIGLYDEDKNIINKQLSMVASSLLDLFKNIDTFPSLNITWSNIKPLIFLVTQGVPFPKAAKFLNNPVTTIVENTFKELGGDFELRHAIVKASQTAFGSDIHNQVDYVWKDIISPAKNQNMQRQGRASEKHLSDKYGSANRFKLDLDKIEEFTVAFNKFRNDKKENSTQDLDHFLSKNPQYKELAKDLMAYYGTLVEDGDNFYRMVVKKLDRDSVKYNNKAQLAESRQYEKALKHSRMVNPDFHERIKNESVHAPFYNDNVTMNVINNLMDKLYNKNIPGWVEMVNEVILNITSRTHGTSEERRAIENKIVADLIDFVTKNFYLMKWESEELKEVNGKKERVKVTNYNTLYEFFMKDIIPEAGQVEVLKKLKEATNKNDLDNFRNLIGIDRKELILSDVTAFSNQIELFRAKYPELNDLLLVSRLRPQRTQPFDDNPRKKQQTNEDQGDYMLEEEEKQEKKPPFTISSIFNMLSQNYLELNLNTDADTRFIEEQQVRDEWQKLLNFSLTDFPSVYEKVTSEEAMRNGRFEFYKENIGEIKEYFRLLAYYSMVQNSHLDRATGSFAYLAPADIIKEVVETSLKNMEQQMKHVGGEQIAKIVLEFEQMFTEMNAGDKIKVLNKGKGYKHDKVKSGKLYSRMNVEALTKMKSALKNEAKKGGKEGFNNFLINPENKTKEC